MAMTPVTDDSSTGIGSWSTWTVADGLPENEIRTVFQDSQGRIWFGSRNKGVAVRSGTEWIYYTTDDGLASNGILSIIEYRDGTIWAAGGGGYSIFDGASWTPFDSLGPLKPRVIFDANLDRGGGVWLAANGGASRFDGTSWKHVTTEDGLPHQVVHSAYQDSRGTQWFACRTGLAEWSNFRLTVHHDTANFGSIVEDEDGTVWFGTRADGAFQLDGGQWIRHLPGRDIRPVTIDSQGHVWAVSDTAGAYRYDGHTWFQMADSDGLASNTVFDIYESADGRMWFATNKGVSVLDRRDAIQVPAGREAEVDGLENEHE